MRVFRNPPKETWQELSQRPQLELEFLESTVRNVLNRVKKSGDSALRELTLQFDKVRVEKFQVTDQEIKSAIDAVPQALQDSIQTAAENIKKFHAAQRKEESAITTMRGVSCWRKSVAIDKVGIYIPGGSAPLFSTVLMLGIPANLAGCKEIVLCTPPDLSGRINEAILFTAHLVGITKIFKVGGAQAIVRQIG